MLWKLALAVEEYWKNHVGLVAVGISYKTSVASPPEMYSGALNFQFINATFGAQQLRGGKLRALANTAGQRSSLIDLPTMAEAANIPGFDIAPFWGVFLSAKTPDAITGQLEA